MSKTTFSMNQIVPAWQVVNYLLIYNLLYEPNCNSIASNKLSFDLPFFINLGCKFTKKFTNKFTILFFKKIYNLKFFIKIDSFEKKLIKIYTFIFNEMFTFRKINFKKYYNLQIFFCKYYNLQTILQKI